jgi:hypothetical protein
MNSIHRSQRIVLTNVKMLGGVQTLTIIMQVEHGRGRHAMQLHLDDFNEMLKYMWLNMLTYFVANW